MGRKINSIFGKGQRVITEDYCKGWERTYCNKPNKCNCFYCKKENKIKGEKNE